ncbi:MAG: type II toxin-antitoxin system CcdA family antitoxin [Moraxellaceae bacterium]|nr:type II toxin-antitoxin system CcdA family antitoxin [Moraxellaceae bacterium]
MLQLYDSQAPKKATNLSINSDLLFRAKELGINLSAALEQALTQVLKQRHKEQWLAENRGAIAAYNQEIEKYGSFGDETRSF